MQLNIPIRICLFGGLLSTITCGDTRQSFQLCKEKLERSLHEKQQNTGDIISGYESSYLQNIMKKEKNLDKATELVNDICRQHVQRNRRDTGSDVNDGGISSSNAAITSSSHSTISSVLEKLSNQSASQTSFTAIATDKATSLAMTTSKYSTPSTIGANVSPSQSFSSTHSSSSTSVDAKGPSVSSLKETPSTSRTSSQTFSTSADPSHTSILLINSTPSQTSKPEITQTSISATLGSATSSPVLNVSASSSPSEAATSSQSKVTPTISSGAISRILTKTTFSPSTSIKTSSKTLISTASSESNSELPSSIFTSTVFTPSFASRMTSSFTAFPKSTNVIQTISVTSIENESVTMTSVKRTLKTLDTVIPPSSSIASPISPPSSALTRELLPTSTSGTNMKSVPPTLSQIFSNGATTTTGQFSAVSSSISGTLTSIDSVVVPSFTSITARESEFLSQSSLAIRITPSANTSVIKDSRGITTGITVPQTFSAKISSVSEKEMISSESSSQTKSIIKSSDIQLETPLLTTPGFSSQEFSSLVVKQTLSKSPLKTAGGNSVMKTLSSVETLLESSSSSIFSESPISLTSHSICVVTSSFIVKNPNVFIGVIVLDGDCKEYKDNQELLVDLQNSIKKYIKKFIDDAEVFFPKDFFQCGSIVVTFNVTSKRSEDELQKTLNDAIKGDEGNTLQLSSGKSHKITKLDVEQFKGSPNKQSKPKDDDLTIVYIITFSIIGGIILIALFLVLVLRRRKERRGSFKLVDSFAHYELGSFQSLTKGSTINMYGTEAVMSDASTVDEKNINSTSSTRKNKNEYEFGNNLPKWDLPKMHLDNGSIKKSLDSSSDASSNAEDETMAFTNKAIEKDGF